MNILGITGLGVAPAACLVQDGKLMAMAEEERFNRIKGSFGLLPENAARFCLDYSALSLDEIDYIVFPWDTYRYRLYMPYFFFTTYLRRSPKIETDTIGPTLGELLKYQPARVRDAIRSMLRCAGISGRVPPIEFIPHHLAHAASSFYCSGFESSYILVIDGSGEDKCTTIFKGDDLDIKEKRSFKIPDSLGWFYQSVTEFLGFIPNRNEGKVMTLAPYGKYNEEIYANFKKMISFKENGDYRYDASYSFLGKHQRGAIYSEKMFDLIKHVRRPKESPSQNHMDIAFTAQDILEKIIGSMVRDISRNPDYNKKLCIAGGIGLNCKMNGMLASKDFIDDIFIPPVTNDAGSALGAALFLAKEKGYDPRMKMGSAYWGPGISNGGLRRLLKDSGVKFKEDQAIESTVAELLCQDKIVGWFQGRMEIGPRALGARSILANPLKKSIQTEVNRIKQRESWRPFAPSMLYEAKDEYLIQPLKDSPFMALTFKVPEKTKKIIPAALHVDDTTRPHLVKKKIAPRFWRLISEFRKISGIPIVLNTSLNIRGEPIACTPEDALRTFRDSNIKYLALGDFLIYK